jgi:hypothetical protein
MTTKMTPTVDYPENNSENAKNVLVFVIIPH